jgi:hypothetical protein
MVTSLSDELEALAMTFLPVSVPPVNETFLDARVLGQPGADFTAAAGQTLNTPFGRPASV